MANKKDPSLDIPSFLLNANAHRAEARNDTGATPQTNPHEQEVDAVMESVMEAVGLNAKPEERHEETGATKGPEADKTAEDPSNAEAKDNEVSTEPAPDEDAAPSTDVNATAEQELEPGQEPEQQPEPKQEPESEPEPEPTLEEDLALLANVERHLYAHRYAACELTTFGETIDPPKASADRAEVLSILAEEEHELLSRPEVDAMMGRLVSKADQLEPRTSAQVRVLARDRRRVVSVSAVDQARLVRLQTEAYDAWRAARANDDWRSFAPYLDRLVSLQRKIAKATNPDADPYDTLLDEYEPGTNRAFYNSFFARIKRSIVPLLSSISMSGRTLSRDCVAGTFDPARQWELARDIARMEGIDEDAHAYTAAEHPFSEAMTSNYAVTAGHVVPDDLLSNIYTMLHEIGHGLYEQGVDKALNHTSLKGGTSYGMHEAQSRFFENYVGRDRAFIGPLLGLMKRRFPGQLSRLTPNQLYRAVNRVTPSLIRTEADELTYPLHIIVRYEIEQLLIDGKATATEVPKLWDERYRKYIGIGVPNHTQGALQDVHWAQGAFGYFPTYALGGAYAAQLRAKMIQDGLDWQTTLASGDLAPIREWLRKRIWIHGRTKDPSVLIEEACGEPFDARYYATYLNDKYTTLYNLR